MNRAALPRPLSLLIHAFTNRPWLVVAFLLGAASYLTLPGDLHPRARVLIAWNVTQWFYIGRLILLMTASTPEKIRRTAIAHDESAEVVLTLFSVASVVILGALFFEITSGKDVAGYHRLARMALPMITLAGVWLLVPLLFAINYAHDYYCAARERRPVRFPDEIEFPSYWDFVYFSVTIAVASQTADIAVTSSECRRLVLAQSVLSFLFNTSVLGLTINLAAGVLG